MRTITLAGAAVLLMPACSTSPHSTLTVSPPQFGWLHGNCIAVSEALPNLPQPVLLRHGATGDDVTKSRVVSRADQHSDCKPLLADRAEVNLADGNVFYVVETVEPVEFAIGVFGDRNNETLRYEHCFTSEGVQFSVSNEQGVIWQGYYYLGYDVEANCT